MATGPIIAVVLAAGEGTRLSFPTPKALVPIAGTPMLLWSVRAFAACADVDRIVVVAHPELVVEAAALLAGLEQVEAVVPGGATRSLSTRAGLKAIAEQEGTVLVHDAARPLVTAEVVTDLVATLRHADAATVAVPAHDTILRVRSGTTVEIPNRAELWHAQTPQGFRLKTLRAAFAAAGDAPDYTDDCAIVADHLPDVAIHVVAGSAQNLKITHPGDVAVAERLIGKRSRPA